MDADILNAWLPDWRQAYLKLAESNPPIRLHPHRLLYYERAIESMLGSQSASDALWPLWHTWTHIIAALPVDSPYRSSWQSAGEKLGLLGEAFKQKIEALDAYLDMVEEFLDDWGLANGVIARG